jgi:hypothetical protein
VVTINRKVPVLDTDLLSGGTQLAVSLVPEQKLAKGDKFDDDLPLLD